ncbi:hypothetical protein HPP92_007526 [Vanilla planifolia]|uniref:Uncharacterized protein n=1 Tax=Vanilla planifolia TaxID=51239 RepID=A0A835RMX7_VANPL|nr:hypothetical protein HPP92_007693 [Vanilla planifolia]KAG0490663.1 hypothetical protein HPP92_007526 [Vanilla planifolia]
MAMVFFKLGRNDASLHAANMLRPGAMDFVTLRRLGSESIGGLWRKMQLRMAQAISDNRSCPPDRGQLGSL